MNLEVQAEPEALPGLRRRRNYPGWAALVLILSVVGGGGWYYFWGSKPKVALSIPFHQSETDFRDEKLWPAGEGQVLVLAGDEFKLCDLSAKREKWSTTVPPQPDVDPRWQAGINARFLHLQQWALSLAQKRVGVSTPPDSKAPKDVAKYQADLKAFNDEVAKYQAELVAARTEAAKTPPKKPEHDETATMGAPSEDEAPAEVPAAVKQLLAQATGRPVAGTAAGNPPAPAAAPMHPLLMDRTNSTGLNEVVPAEVKMLQDRMKKREAQLGDMQKAIDVKASAAKTDLAREGVKAMQAKRARLVAEQDADQATLARAQGQPKEPAVPVAPAPAAKASPPVMAVVAKPATPAPPPPGEAVPTVEEDSFVAAEPVAVVLGEQVWLVEGQHIVSFGIADGLVKTDIRLAGRAVESFTQGNALFVVASAGAEARQLTRIDASGAIQSMYQITPRRGPAYVSDADGQSHAKVLPRRVEFTEGGGSLALVDIRLVDRKTRAQDLIKPGAEKALAAAAENSAAHSGEELSAVSNLLASDSARLSGQTTHEVDESTYEVSVTRPFEPAVAPLVEKLEGRVEALSTASLDLLAAGTKLIALDHANKKLWEATLGAPMPRHRNDSATVEDASPVLETGGKLYVADGAFLSAFQMGSGQSLWRVPNVGIQKIVLDGDGNLYVASANLPVESLTYAVTERTDPATASVMKIDAATGKVLWNAAKYQDVWASGNDVYAFREIVDPGDATERVFNPRNVPEARTKIYKLSRSSGEPIWEWYQPRRPRHVVASHKDVAMVFTTELQVIHSLAW